MSRSRKKALYLGDRADSYMKRKANKKVRKTKNLPNGCGYKKAFCSHDIKDWGGLVTPGIIEEWRIRMK